MPLEKQELVVFSCKLISMPVHEKIRSAVARVSAALAKRPELGRSTARSVARIKDGLTCEVKEGDWTFVADMPVNAGGNGAGPTPGVFGRAALGSCLAIGYMMKAATMGIPINSLEVEVQADFDDGVLFGVAAPDVPPGYLQVRYVVTVDSEATEELILSMLDDADRHSPYLDIFSRAQTCRREVHIIQKQD
jgi:uncharacterized OsmC-like protein